MRTIHYCILVTAWLVTWPTSLFATVTNIIREGGQHLALPGPTTFNPKAGGGEPLVLKLSVAGSEEVSFLVDTGSPITILDRSLESKLGKSVGTSRILWPTGQKARADLFKAPTLCLGKSRLTVGDRVAVFDLTQFPCPGGSFRGILGTDCLRNYCVQLDFRSSTMSFLDSAELSPDSLGRAFRFSFSPGKVALESGWFGQRSPKPWMDTGDLSDGAVNPHIFADAMAEQHLVSTNKMNTGGRLARFPVARFAGETYSDVLLSEERGYATIGLRFLARHLVTVDFSRGTLYLKRLDVPSEEAQYDR